MAKQLKKKFPASLGGISLGKKDTAKISVSAHFDTAQMDPNEVRDLLAAGQLSCRLDRAPGQQTLGLEGAPPTTVSFEATCHRVGMDLGSFSFGLSFPKSAAEANTLAVFAGVDGTLTVTRTGELGAVEDGDGDGE